MIPWRPKTRRAVEEVGRLRQTSSHIISPLLLALRSSAIYTRSGRARIITIISSAIFRRLCGNHPSPMLPHARQADEQFRADDEPSGDAGWELPPFPSACGASDWKPPTPGPGPTSLLQLLEFRVPLSHLFFKTRFTSCSTSRAQLDSEIRDLRLKSLDKILLPVQLCFENSNLCLKFRSQWLGRRRTVQSMHHHHHDTSSASAAIGILVVWFSARVQFVGLQMIAQSLPLFDVDDEKWKDDNGAGKVNTKMRTFSTCRLDHR